MILLDTDIVSLFHRGQGNVVQRVRVARSSGVAITIITEIEILQARFEFLLKAADAQQLPRAQTLLDESRALIQDFYVVPVNSAAAEEFDRLRKMKALRRIGRGNLLIASIALLIASIALSRQEILVTRNFRHFQQVPGLMLENWAG